MEADEDHIKRLAVALSELVKFVLQTKHELHAWYEKAQFIIDNRSRTIGWPHFLWHFLFDADIRMKDAVYAEMQQERINDLIENLNRGVMPSDKDV